MATRDEVSAGREIPAGAPGEGAVLTIGPDIAIPIPDVPEDEAGSGDAESLAVAGALDRLVAEGKLRKSPGPGLSEEEAFAGLEMPPGWTPPPPAEAAPLRDSGATAGARHQLHVRLPASLRRELASRARAEGVSLNTLIVAYLARGLGAGWRAGPGGGGAGGAEGPVSTA